MILYIELFKINIFTEVEFFKMQFFRHITNLPLKLSKGKKMKNWEINLTFPNSFLTKLAIKWSHSDFIFDKLRDRIVEISSLYPPLMFLMGPLPLKNLR